MALMAKYTISLEYLRDGFTEEKIRKYVAELIGTALLVLFIKLSVPNFDYPAIAIGAGLTCIVYFYGYLSFGHFNPSVTLAFIIRNIEEWPRTDYVQIAVYFICQYVGGITGGLLAWSIGGSSSAMVYPYIPSDISMHRAFMAEMTFTFILITVILHVATDHKLKNNQFYGIAIGGILGVSIMCIAHITGCCLNSAVWIGCIVPALSVSHSDGQDIVFNHVWIYWIAPFFGAALSALLFNAIFVTEDITHSLPKNEEFKEAENDQIDITQNNENKMKDVSVVSNVDMNDTVNPEN